MAWVYSFSAKHKNIKKQEHTSAREEIQLEEHFLKEGAGLFSKAQLLEVIFMNWRRWNTSTSWSSFCSCDYFVAQ